MLVGRNLEGDDARVRHEGTGDRMATVPEDCVAEDQAVCRLGRVVGRSRAVLLRLLEVPMTTTELARVLGQSPGTVSGHLAVLHGTGLLTSWRSGRAVLYQRTPLAELVLSAADLQAHPARHSAGTGQGSPEARMLPRAVRE
jgi:DNA-binding transcriptional ArsR family regulator